MPIQYSVLIDFSGFKNVIDLMGGITVHVSQTFTDTQYPIPGKEHYTCPGDPTNQCDYETVHFDAGTQRMDGNTALIYVRSRHAEGSEGSDFARSRRQQEVLVALQDKLAHPQTWATYQRLLALPQALKTATSTDMNIGELLTVGKQLLHVKQSNIERISFESTLTQPPDYLYGGLFVLVPKEDWDSVHTYILQKLEFDR
jgi:LCP family protein required for cell wall assembly